MEHTAAYGLPAHLRAPMKTMRILRKPDTQNGVKPTSDSG